MADSLPLPAAGRTSFMVDHPQPDLFDGAESSSSAPPIAHVSGLVYVAGFLPEPTQQQLLQEIDSRPWMPELKRRVQHYGYCYDYRSRSVDRSMRLGNLPEWAVAVANLLQQRGLIDRPPDQLIVNEYEPGQGISSHIDCEPCFDGNVVSISLGSPCVMNFTHRTSGEVVPVLLEAGSAAVLTGDARYEWMHSIPARKSDTFAGRTYQRSRRLSLTFRKVILQDEPNGGKPE
jgi:alkylated DNA repair dioxygenase AlkB